LVETIVLRSEGEKLADLQKPSPKMESAGVENLNNLYEIANS
jgi:hypothetical protein